MRSLKARFISSQSRRNRLRLFMRPEKLEDRIVLAGASPTAFNDVYQATENEQLEVAISGVLANDVDEEGDLLSASEFIGPAHGSLELQTDGSFTYLPDLDYIGVDGFVYRAGDGTTQSNLAAVTIYVSSANSAPTATDDGYSVAEDGILDVGGTHGVLANDADTDGDALSATLVSEPLHGSLSFDEDGGFTYIPNEDFHGTDSFTYQADDGHQVSDIATVEIVVSPVNDLPVAANDAFETNEDTELVVDAPGILGNDTDIDGDPLTAVLVSGPSNGGLQMSDDGSFVYTPDAGFNGIDGFVYQAFDGLDLSDLTVVEITVNAVNDAPVAVDDSYEVDEDSELIVMAGAGETDSDGEIFVEATGGVLANDSDADGDPISAVLVEGPTNGALVLNPDGSFSYTPDADFNGVDSFTYEAFDGVVSSNVAVVQINVGAVNDAPVAINDIYEIGEDMELVVAATDSSEDEDLSAAAVGGVLANDSDADGDTLTAELFDGPVGGTVELQADGSFTYTPDADFSGTDAFTYRAFDGVEYSGLAVVQINIIPVNDAPVAVNDEYVTDENTELVVPIPSGEPGNEDPSDDPAGGETDGGGQDVVTAASEGVLANDTDADGDPLTAQLVDGPTNGSVVLNADGSFSYQPNQDFVGTDSFTYHAFDGTELSELAVVQIEVQAVNTPPSTVDDSYSVDAGIELIVEAPGILGNDSDADGDSLIAELVAEPEHGTLALNEDGSFSYTPDDGYIGPDQFTYSANDGLTTTAGIVSIEVQGENQPPLAANDDFEVIAGEPVVVAPDGVLANDVDPDGDPLIAQLFRGPRNGELTLSEDGGFTYTPDAGFVGLDAFIYRVSDGEFQSSLAVVSLRVIQVDPPLEDPMMPDDQTGESEGQMTLAAIDQVIGSMEEADLVGLELESLLS